METAKVDIRKLQTLNDSINRTIEALNQVRLSVHGGGLAHSAPLGAQPLGGPAYLAGYALGSPYAVSAPLSAQALGVVPGLGHSAQSAYLPSLAQAAQAAQVAQAQAAQAAQVAQAAQAAQVAQAAQAAAAYGNPLAASVAGLGTISPLAAYYAQSGLGHSGYGIGGGYGIGAGYGGGLGGAYGIGGEYADPYVSARIAQTFPFVHWGYSPFAGPSV